MKYFVSTVCAVVAAAIVAGFFIVGSPQEERLRRLDDRRTSDLQIIQAQIVEYWRIKRALPTSLAALTDDISGFRAPRDPVTDAHYEYAIRGPLEFTLCAQYFVSSKDVRPAEPTRPVYVSGDVYAENWSHPAGRGCFDRSIDPDRYPPQPVPLKTR